jgi:hypothetical protein
MDLGWPNKLRSPCQWVSSAEKLLACYPCPELEQFLECQSNFFSNSLQCYQGGAIFVGGAVHLAIDGGSFVSNTAPAVSRGGLANHPHHHHLSRGLAGSRKPPPQGRARSRKPPPPPPPLARSRKVAQGLARSRKPTPHLSRGLARSRKVSQTTPTTTTSREVWQGRARSRKVAQTHPPPLARSRKVPVPLPICPLCLVPFGLIYKTTTTATTTTTLRVPARFPGLD